MTDEFELPTPDEQRASDAVRSLRMGGATPAFRARLKHEFITGTISSGLERSRMRGVLTVRRFPAWVRPMAWAAAAALLVMTVLGVNRGPAWQVKGASGVGIVVVGNRPIPLNHAEELSSALRPGVRIQVPPGAELEVMAKGQIAIVMMSGTEAVLPQTPGRWFGREVAAELSQGQLRITTGPGFRGARLALRTPEADVAVTGTTLAVICEPHGTCVCVLEGRVDVGPRGGEMAAVDEGRRRFVFNDGREPEVDEMRPIEREKLGVFRDAMGEALRER